MELNHSIVFNLLWVSIPCSWHWFSFALISASPLRITVPLGNTWYSTWPLYPHWHEVLAGWEALIKVSYSNNTNLSSHRRYVFRHDLKCRPVIKAHHQKDTPVLVNTLALITEIRIQLTSLMQSLISGQNLWNGTIPIRIVYPVNQNQNSL